jgi:lycopene cyclase CruP
MRKKLEAAGGVVLDNTQLAGIEVHPDGAALKISGGGSSGNGSGNGDGQRTLTARLVLDCMGHQSPVLRQIRWGQRPDGICLVVGGCASGFDPEQNTTADIICTVTDSEALCGSSSSSSDGSSATSSSSSGSSGGAASGAPLQLFWEAFPSSDSPDSRT